MQTPVRVLFICTGNCCRSQMAEALLRHMAPEGFQACSAGFRPAGFVHPLVVETLARRGISVQGQYSKHWDVYAGQEFDIIVTLCDQAGMDPMPAWPGRPVIVHWPLKDPAFHPGTEDECLMIASEVADALRRRLQRLISLDLHRMSHEQAEAAVRELATM